jgi:hypothetical protein
MVRYSVKPGYCDWSGGDQGCWLSGRDCDGTWTSGMDMVGTRFSCTLHKTLLEMPLGKCSFGNTITTSLTSTCAPNPESCENSSASTSFTNFSRATSSEGETCLVKTARFGSCGGNDDNPMCRFSPNDCPSKDWTFPHDACSCDKVQVGACQSIQKPSAAVCAVDPKACSPTLQTWIPVDEVQFTMGFDCFLCRPPKSNGVEEDNFTSNSGPMPADETTMNRNVLIGTIVGAVGFLTLLLVTTVWLHRRHLGQQQEDGKTDHTPPATVVMASSARMLEEASDDVSIL